jgi:hypothetical protein
MRPFEWLPSLIAALSAFVIGGLWYSPVLFGKAWQRETGLSDERLNSANKGMIFGVSFILCLIAAVAFSMVIGTEPSLFMALHSGIGVGLAWVATSFGVNYLFELKSLKLWFINAGYHTVQFTIYGLVFGLM